MTHEFKQIVEAGLAKRKSELKTVLATVVALDGSSYRRPGVRMLISEDGTMTGAVSGGCVEKEVLLQSQPVFRDGKPRVMTYDGRYRLGCEGILYILLEPLHVTDEFFQDLQECFRRRETFRIISYYTKEVATSAAFGSWVLFEDGRKKALAGNVSVQQSHPDLRFEQEMKPLFRLFIVGAEHDAVQLCSAASLLGWEVTVIASPKDPRTTDNFPGAAEVLHINPEEAVALDLDRQTAVVLMNHSYVTDLKFLSALKDRELAYLGLLGAAKRRERLFNELIERHPDINDGFIENIYGPAGLHLGAETPQEIAVSIIAEILSVTRKKDPFPLREKAGEIHN